MNIEEMYDSLRKDISYEIDIIEGIQYRFKVDDIQKLLEVEDLKLFKKYLFYLNNYRMNNLYIESYEDAFKKFNSEIPDTDDDKRKLAKIFLKHETLFCDEDGIKKLKFVPKEYNIRITTNLCDISI